MIHVDTVMRLVGLFSLVTVKGRKFQHKIKRFNFNKIFLIYRRTINHYSLHSIDFRVQCQKQ